MMKYTEQQQKAISLRNRNILVSAAAGSGKTAILVERIIQRIMDPAHPIDIDRLLVMTFTKAAADQMRERILAAIEGKRKECPFDRHLQKQSALVHNAKITTIHGFCLDVIRNHFHEIDLDPDFRVGDEGECRLLKQDVMEQILEKCYEDGAEDFLLMTESLAAKKSDTALEALILKLHEFSMSYPNQEEWLLQCEKMYEGLTAENFEEARWVSTLTEEVKGQLTDIEGKLHELMDVITSKDGPYMYSSAVAQDISLVETACQADSFHTLQKCLSCLEFAVLGREKKNGEYVDPEKKEYVQNGRNQCKKLLLKISGDFFQETAAEAVELINESSQNVHALIRCTIAFSNAYAAAKREKKIVDFNDLEHLCLEILQNGKDTTAQEYRNYFEELYIDEYQDSNLVQETILNLISKDGKPELFMVGDVKQSIYRFRLARPALFMDKYHTYTQEDSCCQRIDLHHNFRSRSQVLDTVNEIFSQIMKKELGNIVYDDAAALHYGADYPDAPKEQAKSELLLLRSDEEIADRELEAKAIAGRIKELVKTQQVWDKKELCYRPARYADIVILLRTNKGWDEVFKRIILAEGIPVHITSSTGYFTAVEIQTILEYLRIIDNPLQDIPMAASMKSVFGQFTDEELAMIHAQNKKVSLYQAVCNCSKDSENLEIARKCIHFLKNLQCMREKTAYTPVYYLLMELVEGSYGSYVSAMPGGERRLANLNMLLKKAEDYGKTSYKGLFHFVRYIEFLQKYEVDFGEANLFDENDNTVRIMSIHKSKGLEFPICFVAGMCKKINYQDARSSIVLDMDYGIGIDRIDAVLRTKCPTLLKQAAAMKLVRESLAEEMRVFYVALTRAEEKIIMTGVTKDPEKKLNEDIFLNQCTSFLDLMLYARRQLGELTTVQISQCSVSQLIETELTESVSMEALKEQLLGASKNTDTAFQKELTERLQFTYPYQENPESYAKVSVSELKKRSMSIRTTEDEEFPQQEKLLIEETKVKEVIPQFIQESKTCDNLPALHGTAFHRMLELWEYHNGTDNKNDRKVDSDAVTAFFTEIVNKRRMEQELFDAVRTEEIVTFLHTELAARMGCAACLGQLYREQPFVIGLEESLVKEIGEKGELCQGRSQTCDSSEQTASLILVQGIIDAYFIEEGEIVVVDYKTDKLWKASDLSDRYHAQLNYYAYALQKLTGLPVKEKLIYSSTMNRVIQIGCNKKV